MCCDSQAPASAGVAEEEVIPLLARDYPLLALMWDNPEDEEMGKSLDDPDSGRFSVNGST